MRKSIKAAILSGRDVMSSIESMNESISCDSEGNSTQRKSNVTNFKDFTEIQLLKEKPIEQDN
jgi:hypothetical protein